MLILPKKLSSPCFACFVFFITFLSNLSISQISVVNDGLPIIDKNLDVIINGNLVHQNNGTISNTGDFYITGDFTNNNSTSTIFSSGQAGWVHLNGATQIIGGNTITNFNNLDLIGSGIKQLGSVDTKIEDSLFLNDREFASGDKTVFVLSTDTGAITRTNGFISSTNDGGLSRNTLFASTYFFPVGSSTGTLRFRPVDIRPTSATANTYKVRMANVDATLENFDRTVKETTLGEINPNFYHRINRTNGSSPADIVLYFDNVLDGDFKFISQWQSTSQWKNLGINIAPNNYGFNSLAKYAHADFSSTPFALAEVVPNVFVPNIFSPNGDGNNDILFVRGKGIAQIQFIIFDRWGEKIFETTDANIGWDGTFKGEPMNLAVFVYVVKGKFKNGEVIDRKGNVTLLR